MQQRTLGGRQVGAIGLGGMPMSIEGRPDEARSIATIHAALDAGVTLIDTANSYHLLAGEVGHNERLIAKALKSYGAGADDVLVATKGGHLRPGDGSWTQNGDPAYLKEAAKQSLKDLGVEAIGLYQFHRPDPTVPFADSVGAVRDLLDEGLIQMAGVSNTSVAQIDEANEILGGVASPAPGPWATASPSSRASPPCAASAPNRSSSPGSSPSHRSSCRSPGPRAPSRSSTAPARRTSCCPTTSSPPSPDPEGTP